MIYSLIVSQDPLFLIVMVLDKIKLMLCNISSFYDQVPQYLAFDKLSLHCIPISYRNVHKIKIDVKYNSSVIDD